VIPVLTASPSTVSFTYQQGAYPPASQWIQVNEQHGENVNFTATASSIPNGWLLVSPSNGYTSTSVAASVASAVVAGLAPGSYSGSIVFTPSATGGTAITVPATLTVIATPVSISPSTLSFTYAGGSPPASQSIQVSAAGGAAVSFTAQSSNANWLLVTPASGTTPATVTVSVSTAGLAAGVYQGGVSITAGTGVSPIWVPVTLNVSVGATLSVEIPSLSFSYQTGGSPPPSQTEVVLASGGASVSFTATASASWLSVTPSSGVTLCYLTVSVNPAGLAAGTYKANVVLASTAAGSPQTSIPVTLTVTAARTVSASPGSLGFAYQVGGNVPAAQSVQLTASDGSVLVFTAAASSSGNWLSVAPASGTTPATLSVSVSPAGLAAGNYSGNITITAGTAGGPQTVVPVSLTVTIATAVSVNPASLSFSYQAGGSLPAAQSIQVSVSGGAAVAFTAQSSNSAWLSVAPASGTTPAILVVSVSPTSLAAGTYSGSITVNGIAAVAVSLTVTSSAPPSQPGISAVLNAASYSNGGVSPGEMVSLFGTSIGPANPAFLTLDSTGKVSTSLGGVTVSFSGYLAPLTYVSSTQVNAIVPYEVAGSGSASVQVTFGGETLSGPSLQIATTAPAIFTQNGGGTGAGAVLNQDFSLNTLANPAAAGSVVQIYMTGEGLTTPAQTDGAVTPVNQSGVGPITPAPQQSVTVLIGGQPAQMQFAGEAPGVVAGVLQVDAVVPGTAGTGANSIMVRVGNAISQSGVTVWVQ